MRVKMASLNVKFYEKQKDLQDRLHAREKERLQLEQQLNAYLKSDQRISKLRAAKLQSYWKKLSDNEVRSRERNARLLGEFTRIETHLQTLSERTARLAQLKAHYVEQVDQKYPEWRMLVENKLIHQQESVTQKNDQLAVENVINVRGLSSSVEQPFIPQHVTTIAAPQTIQENNDVMFTESHNFHDNRDKRPIDCVPTEQNYNNAATAVSTEKKLTSEKGPEIFSKNLLSNKPENIVDGNDEALIRKSNDGGNLGVSLQHVDFSPAVERRSNFDVQRERSPEILPDNDSKEQNVPSNYDHFIAGNNDVVKYEDLQNDDNGHKNDGLYENNVVQDVQLHVPEGRDLKSHRSLLDSARSGSDSKAESVYVNEAMIGDYKLEQTMVTQRELIKQSAMYNIDDEDEDEDDSDEGDENIKLGEGGDTEDSIPTAIEVHVTTINLPTHKQSESSTVMSSLDRSLSRSSLSPELSMDGLVRLLKFIQEDFKEPTHTISYYQSQLPALDLRMEIIQKANLSFGLHDVDPNLASMIVLEQLTLVARSLSTGCLLDDSLIQSPTYHTIHVDIRILLPTEAQLLWDALLEHFHEMITHRVMSAHEIAAVFVPGMVCEDSPHQRQAFNLLVEILDRNPDHSDSDSSTPPPLPTSPIPSLPARRKPDDVPTLSLGSTVDHNSTLHTDDDSEMVNTSLASDAGFKFNLSDTAAYKSMLSGNQSGTYAIKVVDEDETDDEEDVEKQFHSILPHMSRHNTGHRDLTSDRPAVGNLSDLVSPRQQSDVKSPSNMGTGEMLKAAIVKRRPAIKLDSDSEVDSPTLASGKATDDDIDFDFYG